MAHAMGTLQCSATLVWSSHSSVCANIDLRQGIHPLRRWLKQDVLYNSWASVRGRAQPMEMQVSEVNVGAFVLRSDKRCSTAGWLCGIRDNGGLRNGVGACSGTIPNLRRCPRICACVRFDNCFTKRFPCIGHHPMSQLHVQSESSSSMRASWSSITLASLSSSPSSSSVKR